MNKSDIFFSYAGISHNRRLTLQLFSLHVIHVVHYTYILT